MTSEGHRACSFCRISRGESQRWIDKPVDESENFVAIPSLGSITPGWIMIVPKAHTLNFANFYNDSEFKALAISVVSRLRRYGLQVHMFEHGANCQGSTTGCGVDHAHVHFVPLPDDLSGEIAKLDRSLSWIATDFDSVGAKVGDGEYLLYCIDAFEETATAHVALLEAPISQFFRRAIAAQLRVSTKYDYRRHGFDQNIAATYRFFEKGDDSTMRLSAAHEDRAIAL